MDIDGQTSWLREERKALGDFAEDRARDFVGRSNVIGELEAFAASPAQDVV